MKLKIYKMLAVFACIGLLSCEKDFLDINDDPNKFVIAISPIRPGRGAGHQRRGLVFYNGNLYASMGSAW
jgi:hypothetical protein